MYYYIEIKNKKVISFGEATSFTSALLNTTGTIMQLSEREFALVSACNGMLLHGAQLLNNLENKIQNYDE